MGTVGSPEGDSHFYSLLSNYSKITWYDYY